MKEADLIADIARQAGVSKAVTKKILRALSTSVSKALKDGEKVTLRGVGNFTVVERKARIVKHPRTGKNVMISARMVPKFKAGSKLKASVK